MPRPRKFWSIVFLIAAFFLGGISHFAIALEAPHREYEIVATDDGEATRRIVADLRKQIPSARVQAPESHTPRAKNTVYISTVRLKTEQIQLVRGIVYF